MKKEEISDNNIDVPTCPDCGYSWDHIGDPLDVFEIGGCCDGFIMCPKCVCEFRSKTGVRHKSNICLECKGIKNG